MIELRFTGSRLGLEIRDAVEIERDSLGLVTAERVLASWPGRGAGALPDAIRAHRRAHQMACNRWWGALHAYARARREQLDGVPDAVTRVERAGPRMNEAERWARCSYRRGDRLAAAARALGLPPPADEADLRPREPTSPAKRPKRKPCLATVI